MNRMLFERVVETVVLGALAWPLLQPSLSLPFWRAFRGFAWRLAALLAAYAACVGIIALVAPLWLLRSLAAFAVVLLAAVHWHSAAVRGRSRRWPPGSLRPLALGAWFDRDFFLEQHRRYGSPFKTVQFVRPMACFVGLPGGLDFFRKHEASLGSPPLPAGRFIPGGFLRHMTPEAHVSTKEVFQKAIVREVYEPLEPFMRDVVRGELARMMDGESGFHEKGVAPRRHVQRAVFAMWARLFFHVEPATPAFERLKTLYRIIDTRNPSNLSDNEVREALAEITAMLETQLAENVQATNTAPRSILEAMARRRPGLVEDPTIAGNLIYLMHFTWSDVSGLLQWVFRMLTEHSEWAERLRAMRGVTDSDQVSALSLSTRVVMETLRLEQSEHLYRFAKRDIEHEGIMIPRGWLVRLCVRESHRDPMVFHDPDEFDPDRFLTRPYTRREYSPFGAGLRHTCLGEGLSRQVGRVFAEELAWGYRWRTVTDGPYEYSSWRHWRPSSSWRVRLTPA
ncbi:MAG: cytochrome P450 [Gemmatimonadales bacterium]